MGGAWRRRGGRVTHATVARALQYRIQNRTGGVVGMRTFFSKIEGLGWCTAFQVVVVQLQGDRSLEESAVGSKRMHGSPRRRLT